MTFIRCVSLFIFSLFTLACSSEFEAETADAPVETSPVTRSRFADLSSTLTTDEELERWYQLTTKLRRDFDAICGDTFCEGDYSNYQAISLRCSVDTRRRVVQQCLWVFAASQHEVDPFTGAILVSARHWECALPLAPRTRLNDWLLLSTAEQPLYAPLPGTERSTYDALVGCL